MAQTTLEAQAQPEDPTAAVPTTSETKPPRMSFEGGQFNDGGDAAMQQAHELYAAAVSPSASTVQEEGMFGAATSNIPENAQATPVNDPEPTPSPEMVSEAAVEATEATAVHATYRREL